MNYEKRAGNVYQNFYRVPRAGQVRCSDGGGPFGFDIQVALAFDEIVANYIPDVLVETGSFLGDTTEYLAAAYPELPILSCDVTPQHCNVTSRRLMDRPNARVVRASGETVVIATQLKYERPLYFLDAHWYEAWPLAAELKAVNKGIAVIHDFNVGHPRFSYDTYAGIDCGPRLLSKNLRSDVYWVLNVRHETPFPILQTGRRSGVAIAAVGTDEQNALASSRTLLKVDNDGRSLERIW